MFDIDEILQKVEEQDSFKIDVEEGEGKDWSFKIKRPSHRQARKWSQLLFSKLSDLADKGDIESAGEAVKSMILKEQESLWPVMEGMCELATSWEGVKGTFSKEKLLKYFELYPIKAAALALGFVTQYQEWRESLKKS